MGGMGSGERWYKKATVESQCALDTAGLRRWKLLTPGVAPRAGSFKWRGSGKGASSSVTYLLTIGATSGTLRLLYRIGADSTDLDYSVSLVTTPCHLGGVRWWFLCPLSRNGAACGRRVRKLYLSGLYFGCRRCHGLTYKSTQQSDGRVYALLRAGAHSLPPPALMSVAQLGLAMKALTIQQKRLDRGLV